MTRRVVVTGMGVISPLGHSVEETWGNIKAGKSGVGMITHFDSTDYQVKIAAEIKDWDGLLGGCKGGSHSAIVIDLGGGEKRSGGS